MTRDPEQERLRRWRLVLGSDPAPKSEPELEGLEFELSGDDEQMDNVLAALYDSNRSRGLGSSAPNVNRWLGDIRRYFPASVVRLMQKDALERLKLHEMLLQPETLESVEADVQLVGTLLSLKNVIPAKTKETARKVVQQVVSEVEKRIRTAMTSAVQGALSHVARTSRPRPQDIDWDRTIRRNLKNYLPESETIVPVHLVGRGRRQSALRDVVICVDQSGSMASSVVYSSIFAAVLASLRSVRTRIVFFDTEVVDLSEHLADPVDLLFGAQLGGGTDIGRAVGYCQSLIERPTNSVLFLITDLFEGGSPETLLQRLAQLVQAGVTIVCLLALSDDGTPTFHAALAADLAGLGIPSFACTPDRFPDLLASALRKQDLAQWAARNEIVVRDGSV
ncbi:VWA domain-containing protein [Planctomicrobium sp. SH664]|uniref:VWA domain-containing protein n=1 Tax=Planctomicrobium sp. SH664 TaxID=3448125 RepID=UPI003F5B9E29